MPNNLVLFLYFFLLFFFFSSKERKQNCKWVCQKELEVKNRLGLGIKFPSKLDFNSLSKLRGFFFVIPNEFLFGYRESIFLPTTQHETTSKLKHANWKSTISKTVKILIIPACHSLLWHTKEGRTGEENGTMSSAIKINIFIRIRMTKCTLVTAV